MSASGTWWERQDPSVRLPSTSLGPVHPLGVRRMIIGHRGRVASPVARAFDWIVWMSCRAASSVAAIAWCAASGSEPSTRYGRYPYPRNRCSSSSPLIRASTVGEAIL